VALEWGEVTQEWAEKVEFGELKDWKSTSIYLRFVPDMITAYSTNERAYRTFVYYNKPFLVDTYAFMGKIRMPESASLFRKSYPTGVVTAPYRAENITLGFTDAPKALIGRGFPFF
jgi:hypothetical protein